MTREKIQDFTLRVSNANKTEMIVILYDIAKTYIKDALEALDNDAKASFRVEVNRVRDTIGELICSVNTSTELGLNLLRLYIFCNGELTKAFMDYDKSPLYHVLSIINKLSEAYEELSKKDTSGPIMEHAEAVYQGFTYNRSLKQENVSGADANRGFLV